MAGPDGPAAAIRAIPGCAGADESTRSKSGDMRPGHSTGMLGYRGSILQIADEATRRLLLLDKAPATPLPGRRRNDRMLSRSGPIPAASARTKSRSAAPCAEAEVCRFTWSSSFDGGAVVRIARQGGEITLRWAYRRFRPRGADDAPPVVALAPADWARLQDALIAANFWALDPDGVEWPIDGTGENRSRARGGSPILPLLETGAERLWCSCCLA